MSFLSFLSPSCLPPLWSSIPHPSVVLSPLPLDPPSLPSRASPQSMQLPPRRPSRDLLTGCTGSHCGHVCVIHSLITARCAALPPFPSFPPILSPSTPLFFSPFARHSSNRPYSCPYVCLPLSFSLLSPSFPPELPPSPLSPSLPLSLPPFPSFPLIIPSSLLSPLLPHLSFPLPFLLSFFLPFPLLSSQLPSP